MNQQDQVALDRAVRDAARSVFDARAARVRNALADRGFGSRMLDEGLDQAKSSADEVLAVARENQVVVAGTALALTAWAVRRPAGRWIKQLIRRLRGREPRSQ